ncbi:MAG: glycosyltransferase [Clostridia bacterium]|nr:glycosyltransferase [Clostridia bacterium]
MDRIAVLIPCYNEERTIEKVVSDFRRVLPDAVVYVYDNNSSDRTAELATRAGAVVRQEHQQGKGNVIRRMFREVDAQCYLLVDGDDTYPAESAPEMVSCVLEEKTDMVIGDRLSSTYFTENKRPFHNAGNTIVRSAINRLFHSNILDIMTGYRAFSYLFVKTYPVLVHGFEIETDMTVHAIYRNMQIKNVVVTYRDRPEGSESKLNTVQDGIKVLLTIARMYKNYKPFSFFSALAFILIFFSVLFIVPVLREFIKTGLVPRFPTLITCLFTMLAGLLLFICGLVLSSLQEKDKRDFEHQLVETEARFAERML